MKTKYLFCKCLGEITPGTVFVDVYVGSSAQDKRDCAFLLSLSQSTSYYFRRFDSGVNDYLHRVEGSLSLDAAAPPCCLARCHMSVAKLRRLLRSGLYDSWCATFIATLSSISLRRFSANSACLLSLERADSIICNAAHVKNLKSTAIAV